MLQRPANHRCQIDCTNHDEVINALELKSKDLYYFWRNYEWLYNRYYSELQREHEPTKPEVVHVKDNHDKCNREIEDLEGENERLVKQNKKLKMQLESLRKKQDSDSGDRFEQDYKKELARLKNKCTEYETIKQNLLAEVNKLKITVCSNQEKFDEERVKWNRENKKNTQTIVEIQQTIDQLRSRSPQQRQGVSQELNRRIMYKISTSIQDLEAKTQRLVISEFDLLTKDLQQNLHWMISKLTASELQSVLVDVEL